MSARAASDIEHAPRARRDVADEVSDERDGEARC